MMVGSRCFGWVGLAFCLLITLSMSVSSYPSPPSYYYSNELESAYDPEEIANAYSLLTERRMDEEKRGLDFGMSRGMAGALSAKHMMGLAAANFAGGPGKKRRDPFINI